MMIKTIIGISLICFAAALPWDGENPWTKLLDNQENDELDFIQNDRKWNKNNCCNINGYVYEKDLKGMKRCIRSLGVIIFPSGLTLSYEKYLNNATIFLEKNLILHNGTLYQSTIPLPRCDEV